MKEFDVWSAGARPPVGPPTLLDQEIPFWSAIRAAPKVELHVHVEGAMAPDIVAAVAKDPVVTSEAPRQPESGGFAAFFDTWMRNIRALHDPKAYEFVARGFVSRLHDENIVWAEAFISPPDVEATSAGRVSFEQSLAWWIEAFDKLAGPGPEVRRIVDLVRMYGAAKALDWVKTIGALRRRPGGSRVVGIGLGGPEEGYSPSAFAPVFNAAREDGLLCVAHAGEQTGIDDIRSVIDSLGVRRVGHALSIHEDDVLYRQVRQRGIGVEASPISNLRTGAISTIQEHPVLKWLEDGILVSLGSDDPALFGSSLSLEFLTLHRVKGLSIHQAARLLSNAAKTSTMPADKQRSYLDDLSRSLVLWET